jgi:hypothetical protein
MRDTGGPDTTIGNCIVNIACFALNLTVLAKKIPLERKSEKLVARFLRHGFVIKHGASRELRDVSFLKGMFYRLPAAAGYVWGPLPSRVLKMGKLMADPSVYSSSLPEAVAMHAASLAATYRLYSDVPLIRAFVERFYVEGQETAHRQIEFMVTGTHAVLMDPLSDLEVYYGVDRSMFLEVENMMRDAPLFTFFEHPLFGVLATDYN